MKYAITETKPTKQREQAEEQQERIPMTMKRGYSLRAVSSSIQTNSTSTSFPHSQQEDSTSDSVSSSSSSLLPALWVGDVLVALGVTAAVSPLLTVVDKAIVETSSHQAHKGVSRSSLMLHSMRNTAAAILSNPMAYYRSPTFGFMWFTYAATYAMANVCKTYQAHEQETNGTRLKQSSTSATSTTDAAKAMPTFSKTPARASTTTASKASNSSTMIIAGTTAVNSAASLIKDRAYARMFGQAVRPVPTAAYLTWMTRDVVVVASSFTLPQAYVAPWLQETMPSWSPATCTNIAQIGTPVAAQIIAGPAHLWGLTLYNHSSASGSQTGWGTLVRTWQQSVVSVTLARMVRFLPGYGLAGVGNQHGRDWWKQKMTDAHQQVLMRRIQQQKQTQQRSAGNGNSDPTSVLTLLRTAAMGAQ